MSEAATLVSWDQAEEQGKIPGSDWVCPIGSLDALGKFEADGGVVTDDVVQRLASGRPQHLEMVNFPEGYQAARIVDSETGRVLRTSRHGNRYAGLINCNCGAIHNMPGVTSVLSGRPIRLSEGVDLSTVWNFEGSTESVIKPTEVDQAESDYISRLRTATHIQPDSQKLYVSTQGKVEAIDGGHAEINVRQDGSKTKAELIAFIIGEWDNLGQIDLDLNAAGQVEQLRVFKAGFLEMLGVDVCLDLKYENGYWGVITDPKDQARVLDATSEALGLGQKWSGLDLKMTASGLYAAMGQRNLDPASVLVPQS